MRLTTHGTSTSWIYLAIPHLVLEAAGEVFVDECREVELIMARRVGEAHEGIPPELRRDSLKIVSLRKEDEKSGK